MVFLYEWPCLLTTYDEENTEEGIRVVPIWKWLLVDGVTE